MPSRRATAQQSTAARSVLIIAGVGLFLLSACSGGGGGASAQTAAGSAASTASTSTTSTTSTTTTSTPTNAGVLLRGVNLAGNNRSVGATTQPTAAGLTYFHNKGMNAYRLMAMWQNTIATTGGSPNGGGAVTSDITDLDPAKMAAYDTTINAITGAGDYVIFDPHQGGRFWSSDQAPTYIIGQDANAPSAATFAAWWANIANRYKSNSHVIFEIQNEPHDQDINILVATENRVISAIRATGAANLILVDADNYSGADSWNTIAPGTGGVSNATAMLNIVDAGNNFAFDIHQYLDGSGGTLTSCISGGYFGLDAVTTWARASGKRLFLGEVGAGNNPGCNALMQGMLGYVEGAPDAWLGWTVFAAFAGQNTYDGQTYAYERACATAACGFWYLLDPTSGPSNYAAPTGEDTRLLSGGLLYTDLNAHSP